MTIIGINTHLDFNWTAYGNIQRVIDCINYLGVKHIRDSANADTSLAVWQKVANATGAKFNAFIGQGSKQVAGDGLARLPSLASAGLLEFIEGINEADGPYSVKNGNSLAYAANFQQAVYSLGKKLNLPVINISFGAGWDKSTSGNYGTVGDLAAFCDYANAHTYPGRDDVADKVAFANSLTQMAAKKPIITTEIGWFTAGSGTALVSEAEQATKLIAGLTECERTGNVRAYVYELLDQKSGDPDSENNFGLFRSDGTPKPAAVALRDYLAKTSSPAIAAPVVSDKGVIADSYAQSHPGSMTLNLSVSGSLAEPNAVVAKCKGKQVTIDIWNQSGKNTRRDVKVG